MPRIPFVAALLAATLAVPALAQDRTHNRNRTHGASSHGAYSHGRSAHGGYSYHRPYYGHRHYYGGSYYYPRYYSYLYPAPIFGYAFDPAPYYAPPPAYVQPAPAYAEPAPQYLDEPPPPVQREYRERSYAQIDPTLKAPAPQPAPAFDRITLSATELFAFDQATLRSPQPKLDEIARALIENPSVGDVNITGYTDRLGSDEYNADLSQRRADAVKRYLVEEGVSATRLNAVGRGKANPVVECNDEDRQALIRCLEPNRRVEVERITIERAVAPKPR